MSEEVIQLCENVRSVRYKIGMGATDQLSLWRMINVISSHDLPSMRWSYLRLKSKAQDICQKTYGTTSLKQANTLVAIEELKDHYINNKNLDDQEIHQKMVEALAVEGFTAWIIHNAIKRNNDKTRKGLPFIGLGFLSLADAPSAQQAMRSSTQLNSTEASAGNTGSGHADDASTNRVMFDPVRDV